MAVWALGINHHTDRKSTRLNSSHTVISYAVFCLDRKSTRLNSSHTVISYAVFCLEKKSTRLNSSHTVISYAVFCLKKKKKQPKLHLQRVLKHSYRIQKQTETTTLCANNSHSRAH